MKQKQIIYAVFTMLVIMVSMPVPAFAESPDVRTQMLVTTEWLADNLDNPDVVILHVTWKPENYDTGHIPGAQLLAWNDVAVTRDDVPNEVPPVEELVATVHRLGIDEKDRIVLYDEGAGLAATRAYVVFDYLGLGEQTALLDGQLKKWQAERRPNSTKKPTVAPSSYEPQIRPGVIVNLTPLYDLVQGKDAAFDTPVVILDARPEIDHLGENKKEQRIKRPGRIPGSVNVHWGQTVESRDNPVLRPIEEIRKLYADVGVSSDNTIVTYCQSGVQAAHAYFTLKYLGYKPRLYDGSFIEWSADENLPIYTGSKP